MRNPLTVPHPSSALANRVIVVVDDDQTLLSVMQRFLGRVGATVHVASNGPAAFDLMESLQNGGTCVHAVLCDLRMRGGSGMELHRLLRERMPAMLPRTIFSSGDLDSDDVRGFVRAAGVTVLEKPYSLPDLQRLLTDLPPS